MVNALGFSHTDFDARKPGRLCRGRERWIEPFEIPRDWDVETIHRLTVSGAAFSNDSADDALRGVPHSGVDLAAIIASLFPRKQLLAFMEDGHPADIPDGAEHVELYDGYRAGGKVEEVRVRWTAEVSGVRDIRAMLGDDPMQDRVRGFAVLSGEEDLEVVRDRLFVLTGYSTLDSPPALFQPSALPEVLDVVKAVVLIHRDKHGPALGVYSRTPVKADERLEKLCEKQGTLLIPFAIPPMLARWDRAIYELRDNWDEEDKGEFPIPASPHPPSWQPRSRRRRDDDDETSDEDDDSEDLDDIDDLEEQTVKPIYTGSKAREKGGGRRRPTLDDIDAILEDPSVLEVGTDQDVDLEDEPTRQISFGDDFED